MGEGSDIEEVIARYKALPQPWALIMLREYFRQGLIDAGRLDDREYVWSSVAEHQQSVFENVEVPVERHSDLLEAADEAIDQERPAVSVILAMTAMEHIVNLHYREAFRERGLEEKEIRQALRSMGMGAKLGWMLKVVGLPTLEPELRKKLIKGVELRNRMVHYKAGPLKPGQRPAEWSEVKKALESMDMEDLIDAVDELEFVLSWGLIGISEDLQGAVEVYEKYLGDEKT